MTKFLNISTDTTLSGDSDETVVSEKAIKAYADTKQEQLVTGVNIKTVNGYDLLGSGEVFITIGSNGHEVVDYQAPTADNNYTWYRKYADGWVEQGGQAMTNSGNPKQVTLPVTMANNAYQIFLQGRTGADGYSSAQWHVMPVTTTNSPRTVTYFYAQSSITGYNLFFYWEVRGVAATYQQYDYTIPGTYTLTLQAGTYVFNASGGGGGGAAALAVVSSGTSLIVPNEAGASGGTGAYGSFTLTLSAADTFTIIVGSGGTGATKVNGTAASTNGGFTSISSTNIGNNFVVLGGGGAGYAHATSNGDTATAGTAGTVTTTLTTHNLSNGIVGSTYTTSSGSKSAGYTQNPNDFSRYGYGGGFSYVTSSKTMNATNGGAGFVQIQQIA